MKADLELKKMIPLLLSVIIIVAVALVIVFGGDSNSNKNKKKTKPVSTKAPVASGLKYDSMCEGMITRVDAESSEIGIYDFKFENTMIFSYSGGTHFTNKYDGALSVEQLYMGMIVEVKYIADGFKLVSLNEHKGAWEYKKLKNFSYKKAKGLFTINATDFKVSDATLVASNNTLYTLSDIASTDMITVRGIDNRIWSVEIVKGHGYLTLEGADDLIGGEIEVNGEKQVITQNMRVQLPEGNYTLSFSKDKLHGEKKVYISRFNVTTLDVSDIFDAPKGSSQVTFNIAPQKAVLYIDGQQQSYGVPVILEYGTYKIKVVKDGYNTYMGTIQVNDAGEEFTVNLTKLSEDDEEAEEDDNGEDEEKEDEESKADATLSPTDAPKPTKTPSPTDAPKPTKTPGPTDEPKSTKAPVQTNRPQAPTVDVPQQIVPEQVVPEQTVPEQVVPDKPTV